MCFHLKNQKLQPKNLSKTVDVLDLNKTFVKFQMYKEREKNIAVYSTNSFVSGHVYCKFVM